MREGETRKEEEEGGRGRPNDERYRFVSTNFLENFRNRGGSGMRGAKNYMPGTPETRHQNIR